MTDADCNFNNITFTDRKKILQDIKNESMLYYGFGITSAKSLKVCPNCGACLSINKKYCNECGTQLPKQNLYEQSTLNKPHCPNCNNVISQFDNFCPVCGTELT